jgi:uncharacterized Zn-finger protein
MKRCMRLQMTFPSKSLFTDITVIRSDIRMYHNMPLPVTSIMECLLTCVTCVRFFTSNFQCKTCQKQFRTKEFLKKHERIHSASKPCACPVCDKRFRWSNNLSVHLRIHTGVQPYSCGICQKTFNSKSNMNKHMKVHTGD